ncbi:MAG: DUF4365 domain-containing protein [Acidobacteriaceae bacterium]
MTLVSQIGQRSELLAQLFLQDLKPEILSRPSEDVGFDFLVGFKNSAGGLNMFGIEVKGTEHPPAGFFPLDRRTFLRLAESNVPACLLVADVKQNRLFYSWIGRVAPPVSRRQVSVPVTEINDKTKADLRRQMLQEAA